MLNHEFPDLSFQNDGVEVRKGFLSLADRSAVSAEIDLESDKFQTHGVRNLEKRFSSIARLAASEKMLSAASDLLGDSASLVRALFFDKTPEKNWFVGWHQDKTVTLNKRTAIEGWRAWTMKDGVQHVQPPVSVLNTMVTFRLHIDAASVENGCLWIIPRTHDLGIIPEAEIHDIVGRENSIPCVVDAGDALIMRPHVLHSSSKAKQPAHRRVVHLEYSSFRPPKGIHWA